MKASFNVIVMVAAGIAALNAAAAPVPLTCVSPGPCPDFGIEIKHVKEIECGPWPDLPEAFVIRAQVPLGLVPLAGDRGYTQADQCEMQRQAITGE